MSAALVANMRKRLTNVFRDVQSRAVQRCDNLVDLEKCCKVTIYLQRFVPMQPRTSPLNFDHSAEKSACFVFLIPSPAWSASTETPNIEATVMSLEFEKKDRTFENKFP